MGIKGQIVGFISGLEEKLEKESLTKEEKLECVELAGKELASYYDRLRYGVDE